MMEENRTKKSFRNGTVVAVQQILKLIIAFAVRYIFLLYLNAEYLGLGAVFTNILTVFSLAELGFAEAITVMLFRPLIDGDEEKIKTYMRCIKRVYFFAFCFVIVLGVIIVPFLPFIIGDSINIKDIYLIYSLYVANSAISYLFSYKKVLLFADQNGYISYIVAMIMNVACAIAQVLALIFTQNYLVYYLMVAISTFLENFIISTIINKKYPFLTSRKVQNMTTEDRE
ncbi:MAG: hypothetical protein J6R83_02020, partial [Clostridia bacterium]|nr:hypothetical protein [Clostridia bacterium]